MARLDEAVVGALVATIFVGFVLVFVSAFLYASPLAAGPNRTGFFVFPFGFAVVSGAAGWLAFAVALAFFGLFLVLTLLLVFEGFRWASRGVGAAYDRALEELRLRYARGEITREQFEQMLKDLKEKR